MSSARWSTKSVKAIPIAADELLIIDSEDANPATQNKRITIGTMPLEVFTWTADHDAAGFDLLNVGGITINNTADTFQYIITPSLITSDIILNLPILTSTDTFVFESFDQSLTNKLLDDFSNFLSSDTEHMLARNETGTPLLAGEAVYISTFNVAEDLPVIARAANTSVATMPAIGIVTEDILNLANGSVTLSGFLQGSSTNPFSIADTLYVSNTAGALTDTRPTGSLLIQNIARVTKVGGLGIGRINVTPLDRSVELPNLTSANFWLGDATNLPQPVVMSGDATMDNTGLLTIANDSITNDKTDTFTTTKITTLSKSLLNTEIVYNDQNNSFGAFYQDISQITVPADPAVGTRRLFVNSTTGEISVRTSGSETISLESPSLVATDITVGVQNIPEDVYDDTSKQVFGIDNGSETLGITLGTSEPAGTTYTFTYTITASDFPTGVSGMTFSSVGLLMSTRVINNDAVNSTVSAKFFINDVEIDVGGTNDTLSAGEFGLFAGYKKDQNASVGDIFQVKLWTNGSILVTLNNFGVYTFPYTIDITAKHMTINGDSEGIIELIGDVPNGVTLASKNNTAFPNFVIGSAEQIGSGQYPFSTNRLFEAEIVQDLDTPFENVFSQDTFTDQMFIPANDGFNLFRVFT